MLSALTLLILLLDGGPTSLNDAQANVFVAQKDLTVSLASGAEVDVVSNLLANQLLTKELAGSPSKVLISQVRIAQIQR